MYRRIKYLGLALVMLLGLYPIVELTRVIIISGEYYFPEMGGQFAAEIAIMWTLYLLIIPVFLLLTSGRLRHYRKMKQERLEQLRSENNYNPYLRDKAADYIRVNYGE